MITIVFFIAAALNQLLRFKLILIAIPFVFLLKIVWECDTALKFIHNQNDVHLNDFSCCLHFHMFYNDVRGYFPLLSSACDVCVF